MKVFIFSYGTRGDVQPCVVLAHALEQAGHDVTVAGPLPCQQLAVSYGISYVPLDNGLSVLWDNPHTRHPESRNGTRGLPAVSAIAAAARRPAIPSLRVILDDAWTAARGAELVVHNGALLACASSHIARRLGVPLVLSQMYPLFTPTRAFPPALYHVRGGALPPMVNRASYRGMLSMLRSLTSRAVETWREQSLGLPPGPGGKDPRRRPDGGPVPVLNAVSPTILPPPPDWPRHVHTTGFWLPPAPPGWTPPPGLAEFIASGEPPVYIGFGSMCSLAPQAMQHLIVEAVRRARVRAVFACAAPGYGPGDLPPELFRVQEVPHGWLFPRVAAVVHHGGPGTAAAAVVAGCPQVICPFMADQPFWGERFHRIGLSAAPMPQVALTAGGLAAAIRSVLADGLMRQRAQALARVVRAEPGAPAAVAVLEQTGRRATGDALAHA